MEQSFLDLKTLMESHWNEFNENHSLYVEKGNKSAGTRARKAIGELKKLVTEYRRLSVDHAKASK